MLFVWRGFGWVVPVIVFASFILMQVIADNLFGTEYYQSNDWTKTAAIFIGSVVIVALGYVLNYKKRISVVDENTGKTTKSKSHSLFFIPIEFWAIIVPVMFFWMQSVSAEKDAQNIINIESPATNDLYSVDYTKIYEDANDEYKYGLMKVTSINADGVEVVLSSNSYNKKSGVSKDIRKGKISEAEYFSPETAFFTSSELSHFLSNGGIYSISRK